MGQRVGGPPGVVRGVVIAQAVQPGPAVQRQPEQSHRLNAKKLHITQAALAPDEVTNEQVLAMARARGTLTEWSIGDEVHPQPADPARPRHTSTTTCTMPMRSTIVMHATAHTSI